MITRPNQGEIQCFFKQIHRKASKYSREGLRRFRWFDSGFVEEMREKRTIRELVSLTYF